jgi:uncharacterized membrane protein YebE (DUF533 family)
MFNPEQLLGQILGGAMGGAMGGKYGKKRKKGGFASAIGGGNLAGKAQLGIGLLGIAMAAYEHYSNKPRAAGGVPLPQRTPAAGGALPPPPPPPPPQAAPALPPQPPTAAQLDQRTRDMSLLIQAMIAAAAADGLIDEVERAHILRRADEAALDPDTRRFLEAELDAPKSLAAIVGAARPELAPDIYAASVIAISLDTEAERTYLDTLATRLDITPERRRTIHEQLGLA